MLSSHHGAQVWAPNPREVWTAAGSGQAQHGRVAGEHQMRRRLPQGGGTLSDVLLC